MYEHERWITVERPGYQGKRKDIDILRWNETYGSDNWKIAWQTKYGEILDYEKVFWQVYISGYTSYFIRHPKEADYLTKNWKYGYDKDLINKEQAFDPYFLFNKPGIANQFHNVALNIALEWFIGKKFQGEQPIQIREGKPETNNLTWPLGWRWSPGRIPTMRKDLIPEPRIQGWWRKDSIEDFYQSAKVLQVPLIGTGSN